MLLEPIAKEMIAESLRLRPTEAQKKAVNDQATMASIAVSLKRIADALDSSEDGGRVQGSVLYWLEMIASAAQAGRS